MSAGSAGIKSRLRIHLDIEGVAGLRMCMGWE